MAVPWRFCLRLRLSCAAITVAVFSFAWTPCALAGADEDWAALVALDAGPQKKPSTKDEVPIIARNFLLIQRKAVEDFLAKYPRDPRVFEAKLRQAAILAALGQINGDTRLIDQANSILTDLETNPGVPPDKQADAAFRKVSLFMQSQRGSPEAARDAIVAAARNFTAKYPGDRRGPRLLVEAATICDDSPSLKRDLLDEASRLTKEDALKRRIADDLTRLDLLGRPLNLKATALGGTEIDLAKLRGRVVVIIFWAGESPQSLLWLRDFVSAWKTLPKDNVTVITVALDKDRTDLDERLRALPTGWITYFDGKGWDGPLVRGWGINAIPTVWILDKKGLIRSLNARASYSTLLPQLTKEP